MLEKRQSCIQNRGYKYFIKMDTQRACLFASARLARNTRDVWCASLRSDAKRQKPPFIALQFLLLLFVRRSWKMTADSMAEPSSNLKVSSIF